DRLPPAVPPRARAPGHPRGRRALGRGHLPVGEGAPGVAGRHRELIRPAVTKRSAVCETVRVMPLQPEPLRIAWLVYRGDPDYGGRGGYTRCLARELTELGHRVTVFSGPPSPELDDPELLVQVPSLDLYRPDNPFRVPPPWEFKTTIDVREFAVM